MTDFPGIVRIKHLLSRLKGKGNLWTGQNTPRANQDQPALDKVEIVYHMAQTGEGTDACLARGCLPMLVHFYSPVPDIQDLEQRGVWDSRSTLSGIDFGAERQLTLLAELGQAFGGECRWPENATSNPRQFFTHNGCFSFGCAAALHCMIRRFQPKQVVEIGSGYSSRVISAALQMNVQNRSVPKPAYSIVDPYPGEVVTGGLPMLDRLVRKRVEIMDLGLFEELGENDILFVDSSHTVRTGSDVNFLILEVLPRLAPGVIIHFHDIPLPYEYQKVYFTNPTFRVFWTEAYLLQSFLTFNDRFEILLGMAFLMQEHQQAFCGAFPHFDPQRNWANSESFWIRRKPNYMKRGLPTSLHRKPK
jgi:Methyltransferase domain